MFAPNATFTIETVTGTSTDGWAEDVDLTTATKTGVPGTLYSTVRIRGNSEATHTAYLGGGAYPVGTRLLNERTGVRYLVVQVLPGSGRIGKTVQYFLTTLG